MPIVTSRKVSNSEAVTFAECKRKWLYQYKYGLESVSGNISFDRGSAVHAILEVFFKALAEGVEYDSAVKLANAKHAELVVENLGTDLGQAINAMASKLQAFYKKERERILSWQILGVELQLEAPIAHGLILAGRIDLLIKVMYGPFKGETIPIDHKTAYNFWSDGEMEMNSQGPLYAHLVKHNFPDAVVSRVFFNNIRTRDVKDESELSKIQVLDTPRQLRQGILDNHEKLSVEVAAWHDMPMEDAKARATRSPNPYVCKGCSMRKLCRAELTGQDTIQLVKNEYRGNSYLYEQE